MYLIVIYNVVCNIDRRKWKHTSHWDRCIHNIGENENTSRRDRCIHYNIGENENTQAIETDVYII